MTPRLDKCDPTLCCRELQQWSERGIAGQGLAQRTGDYPTTAEQHLAVVRRKVLLGMYDSDSVIGEVARRLLATGVLGSRSHRARPTAKHGSHVVIRGLQRC
jgi:hypothetical protein